MLAGGATFAEIAAQAGCTRPERLRAWLEVGTELGEIARRSGRYRLRGIRARAIAGGDTLLDAHYRSMLDYQAGCYADLAGLLVSPPRAGRADLDDYADDIARVSLAATPFIETYLAGVMAETRPARVLDVGCGTGVYARIVARRNPQVLVDGIDLAPAVIDAARAEVRAAGLERRIRLQAGDVRTWVPEAGVGYDLILLLNNIYYFPRGERVALYRRLGGLLTRARASRRHHPGRAGLGRRRAPELHARLPGRRGGPAAGRGTGGRPGRGGLRGHRRPAHRPGRALPGRARRPALSA